MLGVRLSPDIDDRLSRHARTIGRSKSVLVREWIVERLDRESIDDQMRRAARVLAQHDRPDDYTEADLDD